MDPLFELGVLAVTTIIPLAFQTIAVRILHDRNFRSVSESKAAHLDGIQRIKAAIRGQVWFGVISTLMTATLLLASRCYEIEILRNISWGVTILASSLFQMFSLPDEALLAAESLHESSSYKEFWDQNKPVLQVSIVPLISFAITTVVAVILRITRPTWWPSVWAMWMAVSCSLSLARSLRYMCIFRGSSSRWRAYTHVTASCIILGVSGLARDQALTRVVVLGTNHLVLVINRTWTICDMDGVLKARQKRKSAVSVLSASSSPSQSRLHLTSNDAQQITHEEGLLHI